MGFFSASTRTIPHRLGTIFRCCALTRTSPHIFPHKAASSQMVIFQRYFFPHGPAPRCRVNPHRFPALTRTGFPHQPAPVSRINPHRFPTSTRANFLLEPQNPYPHRTAAPTRTKPHLDMSWMGSHGTSSYGVARAARLIGRFRALFLGL